MSDDKILRPVVSHYCNTTHSACECVLRRLERLEKVRAAAERLKDDIAETIDLSINLGYTKELSYSYSTVVDGNSLQNFVEALRDAKE